MGNKESKRISKKYKVPEDRKPLFDSITLFGFSDPVLVKNLSKFLSFELPDDKKKEPANEWKHIVVTRLKENSLKSFLAAGHETISIMPVFKNHFPEEQKINPQALSYSSEKKQEFIISLLALMNRLGTTEETSNFYQRMGNFLSQLEKKNKDSGASTAVQFATILMDPKTLLQNEKISGTMLQMFMKTPALSLYGWTKGIFAMDRSIEYIKESLLNQVEKMDKVSKVSLENAVKTIGYIGLSRGSIEDLLVMVMLMKKLKMSIDLSEISTRILELPEIVKRENKLDLKDAEYDFPFQLLYTTKHELKAKIASVTSATDGEYIYFYEPDMGLVTIGVGEDKIKGKIYSSNNISELKDETQLLILKNKLYVWDKGLFKFDHQNLSFKKSKKNTVISFKADSKFTATGSVLVIYTETSKEMVEENEDYKVEGELVLYNFDTKADTKKITITHSISKLKEITLCKDILILVGEEQYEIIDLQSKKTIVKERNIIADKGTMCGYNSNLYAIRFLSEAKGYSLTKFNILNMQKLAIPFIEAKVKPKGVKHDHKEVTTAEVKSLLGIKVKAEEESKGANEFNDIDQLLAVLAYRASSADSLIHGANEKEGEEMIKVYKSPLAIHLTSKCLEVQIKLLEGYYKELKEGKEVLEEICCLLIIFNEHLIALKKCNIPLVDCIGDKGIEDYSVLCKELLVPLTDKSKLEKYNEELVEALTKYASNCLLHTRNLISLGAGNYMQLLQELLKDLITTKKANANYESLMNWLNNDCNVDSLISDMINKLPEATELIDSYFVIELEYFSTITRELIKEQKSETIHKQIVAGFKRVFKKLFITLASKLLKKGELQEVITSIFPQILHKYLKRLIIEIKTTYEKYIEFLAENRSELVKTGELCNRYSKYWKIIGELLDDINLLFCFSSITSIGMGIKMTPEQIIKFSNTLSKSADELKIMMDYISAENENRVYKDCEKSIENTEEKKAEYVFDFPGATTIVVYMPEKSKVSKAFTVYSMPEAKKISNCTPKYKVKGQSVKIVKNMELVKEDCKEDIKCEINIRPKVVLNIIVVQVWTVDVERNFEEDFVDLLLSLEVCS